MWRLDDGKTRKKRTIFGQKDKKHFAAIIKMSIFAEMKTMVFATNNRHKILEISEMLKDIVIVKSLSDVGLSGEIPETADTLEGNALQKAMWVYERMPECKSGKMACFADDTGLEVEALGGRPGYTRRAMPASTARLTTISTRCWRRWTARPTARPASAR